MGKTDRRSFMKLAVSTATLLGAGGYQPSSQAQSAAAALLPEGVPDLQGELLVDDATRESVAMDWGFHLRRTPIAVLKPRSVSDVRRMVVYANSNSLKIAMRGQGHSEYGQALVERGIVIDSRPLGAVRFSGNEFVDAEPGALWGDVAKATLPRGLIPPVMPDAMVLTVGGTLSVGGTGETSYRYGAQVDHVMELDVVTGEGDLVTCSAERNTELFRMTLAGLGQCALIVRARLRLIEAPKHVALRTLVYDDVESFLGDQARLASTDGLGPLNGRIATTPDKPPQFALVAGNFLAESPAENLPPKWISGLKFASESKAPIITFWEYLNRRAANQTAARASAKPNPSFVATVPESSIREFLTNRLSRPQALAGVWLFEVSPKVTKHHRQPLQKMPDGSLSYELRIQRKASAADAPDHRMMLSDNNALVSELQAQGGKVYPPFAPILTKEQWKRHYGSEVWRRFAASKKQFDPKNTLTPGAGIFS